MRSKNLELFKSVMAFQKYEIKFEVRLIIDYCDDKPHDCLIVDDERIQVIFENNLMTVNASIKKTEYEKTIKEFEGYWSLGEDLDKYCDKNYINLDPTH